MRTFDPEQQREELINPVESGSGGLPHTAVTTAEGRKADGNLSITRPRGLPREALPSRSFVDASVAPPPVRKRSAEALRGLHRRIRRAGGCRWREGGRELE